MNERTISLEYRTTYARIMEIRKKKIPIRIESSSDIPHRVLANRKNTNAMGATHLSTLSIMVAEAFKITGSDGFCGFQSLRPRVFAFSFASLTQGRKVERYARVFHIHKGATASDHRKRQNQENCRSGLKSAEKS